MKTCGIYGFRNMVNDKWSIGQSIDIKNRRQWHLSFLRRGKHPNEHFQSAFSKYGESAFEFHILEETEDGLLDVQECLWIAHYRSNEPEFGYNLESGGHLSKYHSKVSRQKISDSQKGGKNWAYGKHFSLEHRRKLSESHKGIRQSEATKRKISETEKGRVFSVEVRRKLSEANKGQVVSKEQRQQISAALTGRHLSEATRRKISEAKKGKLKSAETRRRMTAWQVGKIIPAEQRKKLSESLKRYWKHRKENT